MGQAVMIKNGAEAIRTKIYDSDAYIPSSGNMEIDCSKFKYIGIDSQYSIGVNYDRGPSLEVIIPVDDNSHMVIALANSQAYHNLRTYYFKNGILCTNAGNTGLCVPRYIYGYANIKNK